MCLEDESHYAGLKERSVCVLITREWNILDVSKELDDVGLFYELWVCNFSS